MRITELLKKESIELGVKVSDKEEAVDRLVSLMDAGGRLKDTAGYKEGITGKGKPWAARPSVRELPFRTQGRGGKGARTGGHGGSGGR